MSVHGVYPQAMLAQPRKHLGTIPTINRYQNYAAAGFGGDPNILAQNPRFRARFQRERGVGLGEVGGPSRSWAFTINEAELALSKLRKAKKRAYAGKTGRYTESILNEALNHLAKAKMFGLPLLDMDAKAAVGKLPWEPASAHLSNQGAQAGLGDVAGPSSRWTMVVMYATSGLNNIKLAKRRAYGGRTGSTTTKILVAGLRSLDQAKEWAAPLIRRSGTNGLGSYIDMTQSQYQTFQHESPWHAGAPGWFSAPIPGWGMNPNNALPHRKATEGLGAYFQNHYTAPIGIGADAENTPWYEKYDAEKIAVGIAVFALVGLAYLKTNVKSRSKKSVRKKK